MNEQWFLLGDIHGSAQPVHYFLSRKQREIEFGFISKLYDSTW